MRKPCIYFTETDSTTHGGTRSPQGGVGESVPHSSSFGAFLPRVGVQVDSLLEMGARN